MDKQINSDVFDGLNLQQKEAVGFSGSEHLLVLAGAGSGKTTVITRRVACLLNQNIAPQEILLLTFTRRAAKEMKERIEKFSGAVVNQIVSGTFHSFCLQVLKKMPNAFGISQSVILDRDDQNELIKIIRSELVEKEKRKEFPKPAKIIELYSYSRNTLKEFKDYLNNYTEYNIDTKAKIKSIIEVYEDRKKQNNYLDFDDLLYVFADTLENSEQVRNQLQVIFKECLVDEFQDTNPLQMKILKNLIGKGMRLFCVGDDAQSIYAFRGADFKNVHRFKQLIPNSKTLPLTLNYRSTQEILNLANWLLENAPTQYNKKLEAHRGTGILPEIKDFESDYDEADWILRKIETLKKQGKSYNNMMIMVRTAYAAKSIEAYLAADKIPYKFIGGMSLFLASHVKDLMSLLRVCINKNDEIGWLRYLTMWNKIGAKTASRISEQIILGEEEPIEILKKRFRIHPLIDCYRDVLEDINNPQTAIKTASKGLDDMLKNKYENWSKRKSDFQLLEDLAILHPSIPEFLENYTLDPVHPSQIDENKEEITIITIHSAKGTESDICFIAQAGDGMFPHKRSLGDLDKEEEERRCLYVALTRAKNELYITRSHKETPFWDTSTKQAIGEPYFLTNIPNNLAKCDDCYVGIGLNSLVDF